MRVEVCVESVEGALSAQAGGAHRLELCQSLSVGGMTPSHGLLRQVIAVIAIPVHGEPTKTLFFSISFAQNNIQTVLIRPRAGDFVYSVEEMNVMEDDIRHVKAGECSASCASSPHSLTDSLIFVVVVVVVVVVVNGVISGSCGSGHRMLEYRWVGTTCNGLLYYGVFINF
jgi:hypothetical protein